MDARALDGDKGLVKYNDMGLDDQISAIVVKMFAKSDLGPNEIKAYLRAGLDEFVDSVYSIYGKK